MKMIPGIVIMGEIPSKKNNYRISKHGGFYKPEAITDFEELVAKELLAQKVRPVEGPMKLNAIFYTKTNGDLDNKVTTLLDALQLAGMFENDKDIVEICAEKKIVPGTAQTVFRIESAIPI